MTSETLGQGCFTERMENALQGLEELQSRYEDGSAVISLRAQTHGPTVAIGIFERVERATYSEMDIWFNRYARALREFGVRKGDRIAVMLLSRIVPILLFVPAKLGAVLVPINMRYTQQEIEYVLSHTRAKFAFTDESAWPVFSAMFPWPKELAKERVVLVGGVADTEMRTLDRLLDGV